MNLENYKLKFVKIALWNFPNGSIFQVKSQNQNFLIFKLKKLMIIGIQNN